MNRGKLIEFKEKGFKGKPDRRVAVFLDRICRVRESDNGGAEIMLVDSDSINVSLECGDYDKVVARINESLNYKGENI